MATPSRGPGRDAGTGTLALVTASVFGFVTTMTMVGPLMLDLGRDLDVSLGQAGLLAAAMSLPWSLGAPCGGLLSDRLGRRPLIVAALAGMGVSTVAAALAPDYRTLLALRFVAGLFGAFGPASLLAAVGDLFAPQRRGMAMGWLNMGFSLAAVAGVPTVGAIGGLAGWRAAFAATGLMLLALALLVRLAFPAMPTTGGGLGVLATYRQVLRLPLLGNVLLANLMERSIFNVAALYLPPFLMLTYGLTAYSVAPALSMVAVGTILGNLLGGWLGDRFSKPTIFVVAQLVSGACALATFGLAPGLVFSTAGGVLFGLANASSRPAFLALGSELAPRHRGAVLGLLSLTNQGGVVLGSALGGLVIGLGGFPLLAVVAATGAALGAGLAFPLAARK